MVFLQHLYGPDIRILPILCGAFARSLYEGGMPEDDPNVDMLKAATAVFSFDGEQWWTEGRAVFNLTPQETVEHFGHELRPLRS